jgi:hypothetical protein
VIRRAVPPAPLLQQRDERGCSAVTRQHVIREERTRSEPREECGQHCITRWRHSCGVMRVEGGVCAKWRVGQPAASRCSAQPS